MSVNRPGLGCREGSVPAQGQLGPWPSPGAAVLPGSARTPSRSPCAPAPAPSLARLPSLNYSSRSLKRSSLPMNGCTKGKHTVTAQDPEGHPRVRHSPISIPLPRAGAPPALPLLSPGSSSVPTPLCPPGTTWGGAGRHQIWLQTQLCCVPPAVQQHPPPLAQLGRDGDRDPSGSRGTRQEPPPRSPGHPAQTSLSQGLRQLHPRDGLG